MLIPHKGHTDTIQVYSVTVMTHVKALQAGHSSQGTSEPITPAPHTVIYLYIHMPVTHMLFHSSSLPEYGKVDFHSSICSPHIIIFVTYFKF